MIRQLEQGSTLRFYSSVAGECDEMPIEDPGQEWSESVSPFRKVATIKIRSRA